MEIVVPPPELGRYLLLGIPLVGALVGLAMRGRPVALRVVPFAFMCVVSGVVWRQAMRPMRFAWDERGVRDATFGDERTVRWSDVQEARLVRNYAGSQLRPVRRTGGTYYSGYGSGVWTLADGRSVRVFFEPGTCDALLVTAAGQTYLWAPSSFDRFLQAARAHVSVAGG